MTICNPTLTAKAKPGKGYPQNPKSFGGFMRQRRIQYNLTKSDLAIACKVYKSTIDKWERRVTSPNPNNGNQIIEFLGYNPMVSIQTKK